MVTLFFIVLNITIFMRYKNGELMTKSFINIITGCREAGSDQWFEAQGERKESTKIMLSSRDSFTSILKPIQRQVFQPRIVNLRSFPTISS